MNLYVVDQANSNALGHIHGIALLIKYIINLLADGVGHNEHSPGKANETADNPKQH